jgi:hypothetical protein
MPEPIDQVAELATLRQTVAELTTKANSRKERIAALEAENTTLKASVTAAQTTLHQIEVGEPLNTMASAVSHMPELFLAEFSRLGYQLTKTDGKLVLMQGDKPVEGAEFTVAGLTKLLAKSDDPALKNFKHLMIASRANGGGATGAADGRPLYQEQRTPENVQANPTRKLGLR